MIVSGVGDYHKTIKDYHKTHTIDDSLPARLTRYDSLYASLKRLSLITINDTFHSVEFCASQILVSVYQFETAIDSPRFSP